jgi:hypothetical protein
MKLSLPLWALQHCFVGHCAAHGEEAITVTEMAELGLNVFQVIQNELISREGNRGTLGLGSRLAILEERMLNSEAINRNGKIWKLNHAVSPITSLTPAAREKSEQARSALLNRRGAKKDKDDKDPAMLPRSDEIWEVHTNFPRSLGDFKELQFHRKNETCLVEAYLTLSLADKVRSLLEFYNIKVYRPDFRLLNIDPEDRSRDVSTHIETCMEELAMHWVSTDMT